MRTVLLYFLLVGLPVAGVFGLLRIGRGLQPPASVGGKWQVEASAITPRSNECGRTPLTVESLSISQSGRWLLVALNDQRSFMLSGEIDREAVTAELDTWEQGVSRQIELPTILRAVIDRGNGQGSGAHRMVGVFAIEGCPSRSEISFTAVRNVAGGNRVH
jgi:hypothetical protein